MSNRGSNIGTIVTTIFIVCFAMVWISIAVSIGGGFMIPFGILFILMAVFSGVSSLARSKDAERNYDYTVGVDDIDSEHYGTRRRRRGSVLDFSAKVEKESDFCPYCGQKADHDYDFCNRCGKKLP